MAHVDEVAVDVVGPVPENGDVAAALEVDEVLERVGLDVSTPMVVRADDVQPDHGDPVPTYELEVGVQLRVGERFGSAAGGVRPSPSALNARIVAVVSVEGEVPCVGDLEPAFDLVATVRFEADHGVNAVGIDDSLELIGDIHRAVVRDVRHLDLDLRRVAGRCREGRVRSS